MKSVTLVTLMPIGPNCTAEFVADSLESVEYWTTEDRAVVLCDDSGKRTGAKVQERHPTVDVLQTSGSQGRKGGLYRNLCDGFRYALERYRFDALLRLDSDALIIGPNPEADALACFSKDARCGSAGNYTYEFGGFLRDRSWVAHVIEQQTKPLLPMLRQPLAMRPLAGALRSRLMYRTGSKALRDILPTALANGYTLGEEVFGGACFYSYAALAALHDRGLLPAPGLDSAGLMEDEVFGLTLRAAGFHFADLWEYNGSFGCAHGQLPDHPQRLIDRGAKVIHSVRDYRIEPEATVRALFREHRTTHV